MTTSVISVYIGLGSNLEQPIAQLESAVSALNSVPDTHVICTSAYYRSKAIGPGTQPDYVNAVAALTTTLAPHQLLTQLQAIENQQGRIRGSVRWVARTLDLDLLLYGSQIINTEDLSVPHPRMTERNFVLYPLRDVAQQLNITLSLPDGRLISALTKQYNPNRICPL